MATWQLLPAEIRDRILYFFALKVLDEYEELGSDRWNTCEQIIKSQGFNWLEPVRCLQHFSWGLQTNRYFNNALSNAKIGGASAIDALQTLQYRRVQDILDESQSRDPWQVTLLLGLAGHFLKNHFVLNSSLVETILRCAPRRTAFGFVPRMEKWILQCATYCNESGFVTIRADDDEWYGGDEDDERISLKKGAWVVCRSGLQIYSIAGVANEEDRRGSPDPVYPCCVNARMVEEVIESKPNSWWLVRILRDGSNRAEWMLVNYEKCKIYYETYDYAHIWNNSWDSNGWMDDENPVYNSDNDFFLGNDDYSFYD